MKKILWLGVLAPVMGWAYTVQYTGETYVNLDAANVGSAYTAGAVVREWPNGGTTANFTAVHATDGPTYQMRNGVPVLRFSSDATKTAMTNGALGSVPAALVGSNPYSIEIWTFSESVSGTRTMFAVTSRAGLEGGNDGKVLEMRYSADAGNGVEHWGTGYNLAWYGRPGTAPTGWGSWPAAGEWHHICETYDGFRATLYLDGRPVSSRGLTFNHANDGALTVGGVWFRDSQAFGNGYSGDIARIRVHGGTLTPSQVMENFLAEEPTFPRTLTGLDPYFYNGAWLANTPAKANAGLTADGPIAAEISGVSGALHYFNLARGAAVVKGGSNLAVDARAEKIFIGEGDGGFGVLTIAGATVTTEAEVMSGSYFGTGTVTVGDGDAAASLICQNCNLCNGTFAGSTGIVTVAKNGYLSANYIRNGDREPTAYGEITVEAGGVLESKYYIINGALSGTGRLTVAGTVRTVSQPLYLGESDGTGICEILPGGLVECIEARPYSNTPAGKGYLRVLGGTLSLLSRVAELQEFSFTDGSILSVPEGKSATVETPLSDASAEGGSTFHKTGAGELRLRVDASVTGDLFVDEGTVRFEADGLPAAAIGTIHVAEGAAVGFNKTGGVTEILPRIDKASRGSLVIYGSNVSESFDLSEYPYLTVRFLNVGTFLGTITPYQNQYIFEVDSGVNTYSAVIADIAGYPASVIIRGADSSAGVCLSADNRGMSGPVTVESGRLVIGHSQAAGSGSIVMAEGTVLKIECAVVTDYLQQRLSPASRPYAIYLTGNSAACDVDQSLFPSTLICSEGENIKHTGTFLPDPVGGYRLGSGGTVWYYASNTGFMPGVMRDKDGPAKVTVSGAGLVNLSANGHTYSGGTTITENGAVFATSDGFGAVPADFDEANIRLDLGIIRSGDKDFVLNANRGVQVGAGGAEFHPWGSYTLTIAGGLTGSGPVKITDGGHLTLSGAHNTYQGAIAHNTAGVLTIGDGEHFSWVSTGGIAQNGNGTLALNNNADATFGDTVTGAGTVIKRGGGTLTVDGGLNGYAGNLQVEAGELHFPASASASKAKSLTLANAARISFDGNRSLQTLLGMPLYFGGGQIAISEGQALDVNWMPTVSGITLDPAAGAAVTLSSPTVAFGSPLAIQDGGTLTLAPVADGGIFSFAGWHCNGTTAESCAVSGDGKLLQLTDAVGNRGGSAWWTNRVDLTHPFTVRFTYHTADGNSSPADGFAWMLQTDARALTALGGLGGAIGASGITPSIGVCNNIYGSHQAGWIVNGDKQNLTDVNGTNKIEFRTGDKAERAVTYTITYNGSQLTQTLTQNGNTFSMSRAVDLQAALGGVSAWFGFTAATGGSYARQWITDFSFATSVEAQPFPELLSAAGWQANGTATFTEVSGMPAVRLTPNADSKGGTLFCRTKVNTMKPFVMRGIFKAGAGSGNPADGWGVILQNNSLTGVGNVGGGLAIEGGAFSTAVGWAVNIYNDDCFHWITGGAKSGTYNTILPAGINLVNQSPATFTFTYTGSALSMLLEQDGHSVEVSREIDLASTFGTDQVYIGIAAATGGQTLEMNVYGLEIEQEGLPSAVTAYEQPITLSGNTSLLARPAVEGTRSPMLANLTLADGASVTVGCSGNAGSTYAIGTTGLTVEGDASIVNGSANGAFVLAGTVDFGEAGYLAIAGKLDVTGPVTVRIPALSGRRDLIDLSAATTDLTVDDFALESPNPQAKICYNPETGIVYVVNNVGSVVILK